MNQARLARLVVLISGSGTNLQALIDACGAGRLSAQIVLIVSNKASAYGVSRASAAGIDCIVKTKRGDQTRQEYDGELAKEIQAYQPDWIILAGWMRLLSAAFLDAFPGRVINLHPALPGTFPGVDAIQRAFEAYQRGEIHHTGVMVHLVPDEGVDSGPVLGQEVVSIHPTDSLETLEERVHQVEHRLLVSVIANVLANSLTEESLKNE